MSLIGELLIEGGAFVLDIVVHSVMEFCEAVSKRLRDMTATPMETNRPPNVRTTTIKNRPAIQPPRNHTATQTDHHMVTTIR